MPSAYDTKRNSHRCGIAWLVKSAVRTILTNPRYTGHQVWNKQRKEETLIDVEDVALGHETTLKWNAKDTWILSVSTIHQQLRDEHKLEVSLSSLRRWVRATMPDAPRRSQVTVLRDEVEPGSEAQIDYGFLGQWINPRIGKRHRIWAFVMVLPCSRHMFVRPVLHLHQHEWTEAHVAAFRYFGGAPRRLVPDNLKTGVQARPLRPKDQQGIR